MTQMGLPRKSVAAFQMTAENLWQPGFRVYFWTVTFYTVHSHWEAMDLFRRFLWDLRRKIPGDWGGVRVAEVHPGGHGLHFHLLVNRRLAVQIVRYVGRAHGIGRVHVEVADQNPGACSGYLSKYLSKDKFGPVNEKGNACRRWASFGPIRRTRVRDLVNGSPMWVYRRANNFGFLGFVVEPYLNRCWDYGEQTFKTAWFLAKQHAGDKLYSDVIGLAQGVLRAVGQGLVVERPDWHAAAQPF